MTNDRDFQNIAKQIEVIVIIPTKNRPDRLLKALRSVVTQNRKPDLIYVVSDKGNLCYDKTSLIVKNFENKANILFITNTRNPGLSGTINTALYKIKSIQINNNPFIAFLDDDDWWDYNYLQECYSIAIENNSNWVISGLVRYDDNNPNGLALNIPESISVDDFLITNPNIQGSNLFVKYNNIMKINGFDENLQSTTDRDICIRLLDINTKYTNLQKHLVHHNAISTYERLSTPGSEYKKNGLIAFYKKYKNRMNEEQKIKFKQRAFNLFKIEISEKDG